MNPGEFICRSAIHPKYQSEEVFDEISFFNFVRNKGEYPYVTSVTSLEVAGSEENVHRAGRNVAYLSNQREAEKLAKRPGYQPQTFHYLGYYRLPTKQVHLLATDYHRAEVHWRPEDGSDAHFHIELYLIDAEKSASVDPDDLKSDKNSMAVFLVDLMLGPTLCPIARDNADLRSLQMSTLRPRQGKVDYTFDYDFRTKS